MFSSCGKAVIVSLGVAGGVACYRHQRTKFPLQQELSKNARCEHIDNNTKMLGVQVFFRHGARTPLKHAAGTKEAIFDKEKWISTHEKTDIPVSVRTIQGKPRPPSPLEERYKNCKFPGGMSGGTLTNLGRDQAYALGQRIRNKYIRQHKLVCDEYGNKNIVTRATNVNRTIESLQCVVAGMYDREKIKDILKIQIMPVEEEILFPNGHMCPTFRKLEKMVPGYLKSQDGYKFVAHYIKYFIGDETDSYIDLMNYRDHYVARKAHELEIPHWLEAVNVELQKEAARVVAAWVTGAKENHFMVMQVAAGPMFHMIEQNFDKMISKDKDCPKLHLYSGHDTTLVPILVGIGAWEDVWPPYCSDIAFELHQNKTGQHFVKAVYNGKDVVFPGFEEAMVSYEDFKKVLAPYTTAPTQYHELCHNMELARESANFWEAMKASKDVEEEEYPPNM